LAGLKSFAVLKSHSRHDGITIVVIPLCANCQRTQSVPGI
jgi:hypothetical protein